MASLDQERQQLHDQHSALQREQRQFDDERSAFRKEADQLRQDRAAMEVRQCLCLLASSSSPYVWV